MESLVMGVGAVAALLSAGVLNAVETAVAMISRAQVEEDAKENVPGAQRLLAVLDRKSEHINLLVLLSRLLDVTAAVLTGALALQLISSRLWAMVAAIAGVTLVMYTIIGISS
ncbi:CNNM domain-containing protein, partial [Corynebacterium durum]